MFKKVLCLLSLIICTPAFSGEYFDALNNNDYVMLYLFTKKCNYCTKFNPIYQKITNNYDKKLKFLKLDADDGEGYVLMRNFEAKYVPFVILADSKKKNAVQISPSCLLDYSCVSREINNFTK